MQTKQPTIKTWFPTSIYSKNLETINYNHHLATKALDLKEKLTGSVNDWRCPTFSTINQYDWSIDKDPIINDLIETCRHEVHEFGKTLGVTKEITDLKCNDFWFNIAQPGEYQEYHQHTNTHFSLSYYVKAPQNCGNIVFKSLESMFDMNALPIHDNNINELSYKTCSYTPQESGLVVFRSHIPHMVERNLSNESRIGITMNFSYTR